MNLIRSRGPQAGSRRRRLISASSQVRTQCSFVGATSAPATPEGLPLHEPKLTSQLSFIARRTRHSIGLAHHFPAYDSVRAVNALPTLATVVVWRTPPCSSSHEGHRLLADVNLDILSSSKHAGFHGLGPLDCACVLQRTHVDQISVLAASSPCFSVPRPICCFPCRRRGDRGGY